MPGTMTPRTDALLDRHNTDGKDGNTHHDEALDLARELERDLTAAPRTSVIPQARRIVAAAEDAMNAAQEIVRLMEAAPAEHEQRLAAAHAESETLRTDRDQLAAARLQVAHLHAALQATEEYLYVAPSPEVAERVKAALAGSESTWLGVLAKARAVVAAAEVARDAASRPGGTAPAAFPGMFEAVEALAKALPAP